MKSKLEDEIDDLFRLPLADFTGARNTLAARLKKENRLNEAERVKLMAKPSISAWTVNQLYWQHRDELDHLIATGKRLRRDSLDARRDALVHLSELAADVLRDAGHNPSPDTLRRILTTLEAISAYALLPDGPTLGRLTNDVDPPSFESLASLMSGAASVAQTAPRPVGKSGANTRVKPATTDNVRQIKEFRQARIAAAKTSLQEAKKSLVDARARAQSFEPVQKKANGEAREAEKSKREAEERLKRATSASEEANRRLQNINAKAKEAADALETAKRTVESATKHLESLLREPL